MNILYINSCVRKNNSRTSKIAKAFLEAYGKLNPQDVLTELDLTKLDLQPMDKKKIEIRDELLRCGKFDDPMLALSRQFQRADKIVIAAPYYDLSIPALLKVYIENISAAGITFTLNGTRACLAQKLLFITTSGGKIGSYNLGGEYLKALCTNMFQIAEFEQMSVEGLDEWENDVAKLMEIGLRCAREKALIW